MAPVHDARHDDARRARASARPSDAPCMRARAASARRYLARLDRRHDRALLDRLAIVGDPVRHAMQLRAHLLVAEVAERPPSRRRHAVRGMRCCPSVTLMSEPVRESVSYILPDQERGAEHVAPSCATYIALDRRARRGDRRRRIGAGDLRRARARVGRRHPARRARARSRHAHGKGRRRAHRLRLASHERVIIADDDVRYDDAVARADDRARSRRPTSCVRRITSSRFRGTRAGTPGACSSTALTGGDWPGTLGVRRSRLAGDRMGTTAASCSRTSSSCARCSRAAARERVLSTRSCCAGHPPRATSGRSACARRTTSSRGPRDSSSQLAVLPLVLALAITGHWLAHRDRRRRDRARRRDRTPPRRRDARLSREHAALRAAVGRRASRVQLARARRARVFWAACRTAERSSVTPLRRCGCCGSAMRRRRRRQR